MIMKIIFGSVIKVSIYILYLNHYLWFAYVLCISIYQERFRERERENLTLFKNECWCGCYAFIRNKATHSLLQRRRKKINREEAMRKKRRKKGSGQLQTTGGLEERRRIYLQ